MYIIILEISILNMASQIQITNVFGDEEILQMLKSTDLFKSHITYNLVH